MGVVDPKRGSPFGSNFFSCVWWSRQDKLFQTFGCWGFHSSCLWFTKIIWKTRQRLALLPNTPGMPVFQKYVIPDTSVRSCPLIAAQKQERCHMRPRKQWKLFQHLQVGRWASTFGTPTILILRLPFIFAFPLHNLNLQVFGSMLFCFLVQNIPLLWHSRHLEHFYHRLQMNGVKTALNANMAQKSHKRNKCVGDGSNAKELKACSDKLWKQKEMT